jgi:DNA-binding response OmpR family regulator
MTVPASPSPPTDALQQILVETRQRFVTTFDSQCDAIRGLVDTVATSGASGPAATLTLVVHRLSGLAGTIGFPTVSARAADLERLVDGGGRDAFDPSRSHAALLAIRDAFLADLASPPAARAPAAASVGACRILVAEDEADQRAIVTACLEGAGYGTIPVASGDLVMSTARAERPSLILLDIAMPRLDGFSVCRRLKADPELADIPVIFMTTGANLDDRLTGLSLGAEEFLSKPLDMRELTLRVQRLLKRSEVRQSYVPEEPRKVTELSYDAFLQAGAEAVSQLAATLAVVRLTPQSHWESSRLLAEELRSRDVTGVYGPVHVLILMPDVTAVGACARLEVAIDRMIARGLRGICAGVSSAAPAGTKSIETLIAEADEALAEVRYAGGKTAAWAERSTKPATVPATRTVVVAEDDPDVTRIVDAQMRSAGYDAILASDGEQALAAVRAHAPDVLVLDLMMPKVDGFGVLTQLRADPAPRPRVVVLSGRGQEDDVMRAFELGADDYMTKPFNPQELMIRIARLLEYPRLLIPHPWQ